MVPFWWDGAFERYCSIYGPLSLPIFPLILFICSLQQTIFFQRPDLFSRPLGEALPIPLLPPLEHNESKSPSLSLLPSSLPNSLILLLSFYSPLPSPLLVFASFKKKFR